MLMLLAFEVCWRRGRLPRAIGQTVSIVGAVVVGQAAISAKYLASVVITIAAAGISGFVVPSQDLSNAIRFCRVFWSCARSWQTVRRRRGAYRYLVPFVLDRVVRHPYMSPFVVRRQRDVQRHHDQTLLEKVEKGQTSTGRQRKAGQLNAQGIVAGLYPGIRTSCGRKDFSRAPRIQEIEIINVIGVDVCRDDPR